MALAFWMAVIMALSNSTQESASGKPAERAPAAGFLYKTLEFKNETYAYCVYAPPEYDPKQKWPVILALHGSGERGSDGFLQTEVGIGTAIRRNRGLCPAIVVMPQCRPNHWWTEAMAEMALKCVEKTSGEYNLDPQRLYLTGLSMGGAGAWSIAAQFPGRFAAVVPICGFVGRPDRPADAVQLKDLGTRLSKTPIWCWHGAADTSVPPRRTQEVVTALRDAGGSPKHTEPPDVAHNAWDAAYASPELWRWMLEQKTASDAPRLGEERR